MPDFAASVHGNFNSELTWSFGTKITTSQPIDTLAATWDNAWAAAWDTVSGGMKTYYPTTTNMTSTRVAALDATMHETQNVVTSNLRPGNAAGDTLPYLNSIVVSQRSTFSKRWNRGRFYLPALEETFVNDNVLDLPAATALAAQVRSVFTAITADGSTFFVTSKKPHKDGTGQYQKTVINLWEVSRKPARQARRVKKQIATYV